MFFKNWRTNKRKKLKIKSIIILIIAIIVVTVIISLIVKNQNQNENKTNSDSTAEDNQQSSIDNYIEFDMPDLVGKTDTDIVDEYNLKEEILKQLLKKELKKQLKEIPDNFDISNYIPDNSIYLKGSYIIEGSGDIIENQKPAAGTKIKILNDGEGILSLEEDIYLYVKGGGSTQKIDVDKDLKNTDE